MTTQPQLDLEQLVREHQAGVWWYLRFLGADEATADDLTQDTFLACMRWPPTLRDPAAIGGYLRTVARNALARAHRRRQLPGALSPDDLRQLADAWERLHPAARVPNADAGSSSGDPDGVLAALADCLQRLPERTRQLVRLKYEQDRTSAEIARETGLGESNVRVTLHRALRQLHACVTGKLK